MPSAAANGISIEYTTTGDPDRPPLLLIMGLGAQLTAWDDEFVEGLARRGFYVIRYDNRDVGRSTWFDDAGVPDLAAALVGGDMPQPVYLVADMADDAAGLLDALGIPSAHVLGASMGGMIAQSFAIQYPERVRTLVSIMSTTGDPSVGQPHPEVLGDLLAEPPTDRAAAIDQSVKMWSVIGSTGYPFHEERIRANAASAYDRAFHPDGTARQTVAILASPDRTPGLAEVTVPTLVIHGESDPLVDPSGGRATAEAIPGASLWTIPGMGHDLPPELFEEITERVATLALG
jgi:pimeloyl-ACP methyl ester carboxylesterase